MPYVREEISLAGPNGEYCNLHRHAGVCCATWQWWSFFPYSPDTIMLRVFRL